MSRWVVIETTLAPIGPERFCIQFMLGWYLSPMGSNRVWLGPKTGRDRNDFGPNWARKVLYTVYVGMVLIPNGPT